MELWLIRAGANGEFEQRFWDEKRVYLTWDSLAENLANFPDRQAIQEHLEVVFPDEKSNRLKNHSSQIWPFVGKMKVGDWFVLPSKTQPVVHVGKITSDFQYSPEAPERFRYWRSVEWIATEVPRSHFGQDLLYSFGAFMTICRIHRNNALKRIQVMASNNWSAETLSDVLNLKSTRISSEDDNDEVSDDATENLDLVDIARQQVIRAIESNFKGHDLTKLVSAILKAQGYTLWQSPAGADGGADILAANGAMGFGSQTICVEVKSESNPIDRPTVDKLLGAMSKFNADHGLFVAWGGFKNTVQKELATSFFRLRLWSQDDLLNELFAVYDKLDDDIKVKLPLKRTWIVVPE